MHDLARTSPNLGQHTRPSEWLECSVPLWCNKTVINQLLSQVLWLASFDATGDSDRADALTHLSCIISSLAQKSWQSNKECFI